MEKKHNVILDEMILICCKFLNYLPLFHLSCDESFDTIKSMTNFRFSFISLPWGDKHLYFLSYKKGIKFFHVLRLSDINKPYEEEQVNDLTDKFLSLEDDKENLNSQLRIEFLKFKYAELQNSINTLNNKVNNYIAISLVYIGVFTYLFKIAINVTSLPFVFFIWILLTLFGINLLNVLILLRRYLQVKSYMKSKFSSFKQSPDWRSLAKSFYIDWLTSKDEQNASASLVLNIEKYFIRSIVFSLLLFFSITIEPYMIKTSSVNNSLNYNEIVLVDEYGKFSPEGLLKLSKNISLDKKVVFIYSSSNILAKDTIDFTIKILNLSKHNLIIKLNDRLFDNKMIISVIE
ncbi:hypothetical protein VXS03_07150 [Photobacterium sp. S4TG1]|uniref:hypothetical protein n=1 Tax=Photobacterium sp. S4TG1 TaxID=3114587 RepID=UPI002E16F724|nr:hypothetical protein [Photobacterium sp. S4TG1]